MRDRYNDDEMLRDSYAPNLMVRKLCTAELLAHKKRLAKSNYLGR